MQGEMMKNTCTHTCHFNGHY